MMIKPIPIPFSERKGNTAINSLKSLFVLSNQKTVYIIFTILTSGGFRHGWTLGNRGQGVRIWVQI